MSKSTVLPSPLQAMLCAATEKMLNGLIHLDPFHHFEAFEGKVFYIVITDFTTENESRTGDFGKFFLIFHQNQIAVQTQLQGEPDATLSTDLYSLKRLKKNQGLMRLTLSGDVALAEQLIEQFAQLEPDWEEALSHYCGDFLAFQISHFFRKLGELSQKQRQYLGDTTAEYLHYEINLLPTQSQVNTWQQQVTETTDTVNALEKRIEMLENLLLAPTQETK